MLGLRILCWAEENGRMDGHLLPRCSLQQQLARSSAGALPGKSSLPHWQVAGGRVCVAPANGVLPCNGPPQSPHVIYHNCMPKVGSHMLKPWPVLDAGEEARRRRLLITCRKRHIRQDMLLRLLLSRRRRHLNEANKRQPASIHRFIPIEIDLSLPVTRRRAAAGT